MLSAPRHRLFSALLLALAPILLLASPAPAQEQPPALEVEEEIEITEVLLDVLVTDGEGNVIVGLDEDDFIVEEEGERVELTSATFYSNRRFVDTMATAENLDVDPADIPVDRFFVLFFHDRRSELPDLMSQMLESSRFAKEWAGRELLANDWVAVVAYDHKLQVYQDFTTDKSEVVDAIDRAVRRKNPIENWPSRREGHEGPSLLENLPEGRDLRKETYDFHHALRLVAEAAGTIIGRKNLVLLSPGFGEIDEFRTYSPDPRWYPPMMQALNHNNVAVYAVDLVPTSEPGGSAINRTLNDSLSQLANETGGKYYWNFNSFGTPFEQIEEDNNGYYLLSYTSRYPAGEEGFRKVTVDTENPDFVVRARTGYRYGEE